MHNEIELNIGNVLILMLGLAITWWMSRAPKSLLKLMSARFPGLDKDRPWLTWIVRWWGRFTFFTLTFGMLVMFTPDNLAHTAGFSLVSMLLAAGISVFALRRPPRKEEDAFSASLKSAPQAGSSRPII